MPVNASNQQVVFRADEAEKRAGITFADLCELVDRGREAGTAAETVVSGDTWIRGSLPKGRNGYRLKFIEV